MKLSVQAISEFTNTDHTAIFNRLYFSKYNIKVAGIKHVARNIYIEERTLFSYRKKYCKVIMWILDYIRELK